MSLLTCSLQLLEQSKSATPTGESDCLLDRNQLVLEAVNDQDRTCHLPDLARVVEPLSDQRLSQLTRNRLDDAFYGCKRTDEDQGAEVGCGTYMDGRPAAYRPACITVDYLLLRCFDLNNVAC